MTLYRPGGISKYIRQIEGKVYQEVRWRVDHAILCQIPLPDDCRNYEIQPMLIPTESHCAVDGIQMSLMSQDRDLYLFHSNDPRERLFIQLRRSYFLQLGTLSSPIKNPLLVIFLLCAFGSLEDVEKNELLFKQRQERTNVCPYEYDEYDFAGTTMKEAYVFVGIAIKYANFSVAQWFLTKLSIFEIERQATYMAIFEIAAEYGYANVVKDLVRKSICRPAYGSNFAIRIAAERGHSRVVDYLLRLDSSYGIDPAVFDNIVILKAAQYGHLNIVTALMDLPPRYRVDPATRDNLPMLHAADQGHLDILKYLMTLDPKFGIDPAAQNNTAIRWAAQSGRLDVVQYLMDLPRRYRVDPTVRDNFALRKAAQNGHVRIVHLMIHRGIHPASQNHFAIRSAAQNGHLDVIQCLMQKDSTDTLNFKNVSQALKLAKENGHQHVIAYLALVHGNV